MAFERTHTFILPAASLQGHFSFLPFLVFTLSRPHLPHATGGRIVSTPVLKLLQKTALTSTSGARKREFPLVPHATSLYLGGRLSQMRDLARHIQSPGSSPYGHRYK